MAILSSSFPIALAAVRKRQWNARVPVPRQLGKVTVEQRIGNRPDGRGRRLVRRGRFWRASAKPRSSRQAGSGKIAGSLCADR